MTLASKFYAIGYQTPCYWSPISMLLEKQPIGIIEEAFSVCVKMDGGEATFVRNRDHRSEVKHITNREGEHLVFHSILGIFVHLGQAEDVSCIQHHMAVLQRKANRNGNVEAL